MKTKNLVIHDLSPAEWEKISSGYSGWNVVTDNGGHICRAVCIPAMAVCVDSQHQQEPHIKKKRHKAKRYVHKGYLNEKRND